MPRFGDGAMRQRNRNQSETGSGSSPVCGGPLPRLIVGMVAAMLVVTTATPAAAARFLTYIPLDAGSAAVDTPAVQRADGCRLPIENAADDRAWSEYLAAWRDHADDPAEHTARKRLGLPTEAAVTATVSDGVAVATALSRSLRVSWNQPRRVDTDHFMILADTSVDDAIEVAADLERFHAVWTQLFFPLWKDRQRWDRTRPRGAGGRGSEQPRFRVVVFRDRQQYTAALAAEGAAIGSSTGYYSPSMRITFLYQPGGQLGQDPDGDQRQVGGDAAAAAELRGTRYHELTHQLLAEATETRLRAMPGERSGFWLAEGIACYMESTAIRDGYATVGGWESSRLQFARHRVLAGGDSMPLRELESWGRLRVQRSSDPARFYAFAAAECHRIIDAGDGDGLPELLGKLARLYQIRLASRAAATEEITLRDYLAIDNARLTAVTRDDLVNLCLSRCAVDAAGLRRIEPQLSLRWLDLTALPVTTDDLLRLVPDPATIRQLSLEATRIDDSIAGWIARATILDELDLSWTATGDRVIGELSAAGSLETLWLTGTAVSDASLDPIASIKTLRRVDLQRTNVSDEGRQRFRARRPDVTLDPLQLVPAP